MKNLIDKLISSTSYCFCALKGAIKSKFIANKLAPGSGVHKPLKTPCKDSNLSPRNKCRRPVVKKQRGQYWAPKEELLLNNDLACNILKRNIFIVDGGSTNHLFSPVDKVRKNAKIFAFDPSPEVEIYESVLPVKHVPFALWSKKESICLNVANRPGTSSVYPPNQAFLARFEPRVGWEARRTVQVAEVSAISIDAAISEGVIDSFPDLIKLDIHSSEWDAIVGAEDTLESVSAIVIEGWHHPLHHGQHKHGKIENFLNSKGFLLYDLRKASAWLPLYRGRKVGGRAILVGSESVYFRPPSEAVDLVVSLFLFDLFGFGGEALFCLSLMEKTGLISKDNFSYFEYFLISKYIKNGSF